MSTMLQRTRLVPKFRESETPALKDSTLQRRERRFSDLNEIDQDQECRAISVRKTKDRLTYSQT
jgi:hypothetical protein